MITGLEYAIGAVGIVVTFVVAVGVYSYYEIERSESKRKS